MRERASEGPQSGAERHGHEDDRQTDRRKTEEGREGKAQADTMWDA